MRWTLSALLVVTCGCAASSPHPAMTNRAGGSAEPWPFPPPAWYTPQVQTATRPAGSDDAPSIVVDVRVLRWPASATASAERTRERDRLDPGASHALDESRSAALLRAAKADGAELAMPRIVLRPDQSGAVWIGDSSADGKDLRAGIKLWVLAAKLNGSELTLRYAVQSRESRNENHFITWQCAGSPRLLQHQDWAHRADCGGEVALVLLRANVVRAGQD